VSQRLDEEGQRCITPAEVQIRLRQTNPKEENKVFSVFFNLGVITR